MFMGVTGMPDAHGGQKRSPGTRVTDMGIEP